MRIGIDIDGVLVDIVSPLLELYNAHKGTGHRYEDVGHYDLHQTWNCSPQEAIDWVHQFYATPAFDEMPVIDGAVAGVTRLSKGHELFIITSRPAYLQEKTKAWIERYFGDAFVEILFGNAYSLHGPQKDKSTLCSEKDVRVLIEDAPGNAIDCAQAGIEVFLFDQPWNRKMSPTKNVTRVMSWDEIGQRFLV
ncbi:MAG: hypothetical protein AABW68_00790 [archaeon]